MHGVALGFFLFGVTMSEYIQSHTRDELIRTEI
jgi:hypothetical protein